MVQTIKLDNINNYIIDKDTQEVIERYDPSNKNVELFIKLPDSTLRVDGDQITEQFGGNIVFKYGNDKYIINDGYQDTMIKCGYIVYKQYDQEKEPNKSKGVEIQRQIISSIRALLPDLVKKYNTNNEIGVIVNNGNETEFIIGSSNENHYTYTIKISTINYIVKRNQIRKDNDLQFYPFSKSMDRYGTLYLSVFAKKNYKAKNDPDKYSLIDSMIKELVSELGKDYHYVSMPNKGRIINYPGL